MGDLLELFQRQDVALCSLTESLDTASASGRLMLHLLASVSQWEREAIAERTAFALAHKRRNGNVYGPVPYGFARVGNQLVRDEAQQAVLGNVRAMREEGKSLRHIVAWLNYNEVRTPRGSAKWFLNTLHQVLNSKAAKEASVA